jgi:hypothetical protein
LETDKIIKTMNNTTEESNQDDLYSRKVIDMLTVSNEYCLFIEKAEDHPREEILQYVQKLIPLIYLKASLLPVIPVNDENAAEHFVTEEQWENLFNTLSIKFGDDDIYYFIDLHEKSHSDPVRASLAENLTDLYQDLKDFVLLYQKPLRISQENAVRDCKNLFETRFGYRLVNAQQAIHYILYSPADSSNYSDLD